MIIISDTTPIITLLKINELNILYDIYRRKVRTKEEILKIINLIKEKRNCYSEELFDMIEKELN